MGVMNAFRILVSIFASKGSKMVVKEFGCEDV